jgi:hypothetical protein
MGCADPSSTEMDVRRLGELDGRLIRRNGGAVEHIEDRGRSAVGRSWLSAPRAQLAKGRWGGGGGVSVYRHAECAALDGLVSAVRAGESRSLLMIGEPGVGKTALLAYLVGRASGCRVVRRSGVEAEMELAFAYLHQLCAPLLDRAERLPGPQREGTAQGSVDS